MGVEKYIPYLYLRILQVCAQLLVVLVLRYILKEVVTGVQYSRQANFCLK